MPISSIESSSNEPTDGPATRSHLSSLHRRTLYGRDRHPDADEYSVRTKSHSALIKKNARKPVTSSSIYFIDIQSYRDCIIYSHTTTFSLFIKKSLKVSMFSATNCILYVTVNTRKGLKNTWIIKDTPIKNYYRMIFSRNHSSLQQMKVSASGILS